MPGSDDIYDWDLWQFNGSKFISFGGEFAHQRILAFNFFGLLIHLAGKLITLFDGTKFISDAAPYNEGATLEDLSVYGLGDFIDFMTKPLFMGHSNIATFLNIIQLQM